MTTSVRYLFGFAICFVFFLAPLSVRAQLTGLRMSTPTDGGFAIEDGDDGLVDGQIFLPSVFQPHGFDIRAIDPSKPVVVSTGSRESMSIVLTNVEIARTSQFDDFLNIQFDAMWDADAHSGFTRSFAEGAYETPTALSEPYSLTSVFFDDPFDFSDTGVLLQIAGPEGAVTSESFAGEVVVPYEWPSRVGEAPVLWNVRLHMGPLGATMTLPNSVGTALSVPEPTSLVHGLFAVMLVISFRRPSRLFSRI